MTTNRIRCIAVPSFMPPSLLTVVINVAVGTLANDRVSTALTMVANVGLASKMRRGAPASDLEVPRTSPACAAVCGLLLLARVGHTAQGNAGARYVGVNT